MIPVRNEDVVVERRAHDGRFVLFTSTDVRPEWPLRWWGATIDTGGDGLGLLVRLDETAAPAGWTAHQLLHVARARAEAEAELFNSARSRRAAEALAEAAVRIGRIPVGGDPVATVAFRPGPVPSPYPWAVASQGGFDLALCPDPACLEEGVAPELLLIVLHQLLGDAADRGLFRPTMWAARGLVSAALRLEVARVTALRA